MERFNYPSLKALYKESSEILQLLEAESFGDKADDKEKISEMEQSQSQGIHQYG